VIAFDAHVLDDNTPQDYVRHYVKEASFFGKDTWNLDFVPKLDEDEDGGGDGKGALQINFIGIQENGMWPGKKAVKAEGGVAIRLFEKLDAWMERRTGRTADTLLLGWCGGCVRWVVCGVFG
jgi:hypothetical protein